MAKQGRTILGTAGLVAGYLAVTGLLAWGTAGTIRGLRAAGGPDIGAELAVAAAAGSWLVLTWLTAVTLAAVLTAVVAGIGSRAHHRALHLVPPVARRLVAALLGLTVVAGPLLAAGPTAAAESLASVRTGVPVASADRDPGHSAERANPAAVPAAPVPLPSLDRPVAAPPPGWTPDRPAGAQRRPGTDESAVRLVSTAARRGRDAVDEVVVRRGDTLWDIAARHLGPHPSAADIAREWPHWYAANRAVIGADPDLLLPGQRLVPPRS